MEHTDTQNQTVHKDNQDPNTRDDHALYAQYEAQGRALADELTSHQQQDQLEQIVFSLRKSLPDIDSSMDAPLDNLLETNAYVLNAAFVYYMNNAHKSPDADRKINLALRAHAQMVRAINTWDRVRSSKNEETN